MSYLCPVCNSELVHVRVNDGMIVRNVSKDGEVSESINTSDGYDTVVCSNDEQHDIPNELQIKIIEL